MSDPERPWEPPLAGTEVEQLLGALDRLRATFRWKADGLDSSGLRVQLASSVLTLGGLLKHLAAVEDFTFTEKLDGSSMGELWSDAPPDDNEWEFTSASADSAAELYALWDGAVERSRARLSSALRSAGGLAQAVHAGDEDGNHASLRRLVCDLIEEYGRHTGHADLIREAVDGRVGEDPPPGWRPTPG